jgi:hypothetical protein
MSASKPAIAAEHDPVFAAFENAPLDPDALTPDEAEALDAQMAAGEERMARGERTFRSSAEVTAEISARAKREG